MQVEISLIRRSIQFFVVTLTMCLLACCSKHNEYVHLLTNDSIRYWYDIYPSRGGHPQLIYVCEFHRNGTYNRNYVYASNGNKIHLKPSDLIGPDSWNLEYDSTIVFRHKELSVIGESEKIIQLSDDVLVLIGSDSIIRVMIPSELFYKTRFKNN